MRNTDIATTPLAAPASALSPQALLQARQTPGAPSLAFTEAIMARAARLPAPHGQGAGPNGFSTGRVTNRGRLPGGGVSPVVAPHRPPGSFFPGSGIYLPPGFGAGSGYPPAPAPGAAPADGPYLLTAADARLTAAQVFRLLIAQATAPADITRLWLDTSVSPAMPRYYDGSAWQSLVGPAGAAGAVGTTGAGAGTQILSGAGAPSDARGHTYDYYLNTLTGELYQKGGAGWGSRIMVLKGTPGQPGAPGIAGTNGSTIYNGLYPPSDANPPRTLPTEIVPGVNGDYYLETPSGDLYQKQAGSWVLVMSLVGPAGPRGPRGPVGDIGPTGDTGPPGTAATIQIGGVTTGAAGTEASVTNVGTWSTASLNFTIPRGADAAGLVRYHLSLAAKSLTFSSNGRSFRVSADVSALGGWADMGVIPILQTAEKRVIIATDDNLFGNGQVGWTIYIPSDVGSIYAGYTADFTCDALICWGWTGSSVISLPATWTGPLAVN